MWITLGVSSKYYFLSPLVQTSTDICVFNQSGNIARSTGYSSILNTMTLLPFPLDKDYRDPLINVASWITMALVVFAVFAKVTSKLWKIHIIQGDDVLVLAAMIRIYPSFL